MHYPKFEGELTPLQPPDIDFHKLVSTLGNYPELMRRLGLVIDLEVPVPSGVSNSTVKVFPSWAPDSPPSAFNTDFSPKTACTLDLGKGRYFARPETADSKIAGGLLNLSDDKSYPVVHVDVAGSALKMVNLADRLASSSLLQTPVASSALRPMMLPAGTAHQPAAGAQAAGAPAAAAGATQAEATATLPALRTAGISLAETNRALWFAGVMAKASLKNQAVEANTPDQVTHYAEDLVRGYRVDAWDSQSKQLAFALPAQRNLQLLRSESDPAIRRRRTSCNWASPSQRWPRPSGVRAAQGPLPAGVHVHLEWLGPVRAAAGQDHRAGWDTAAIG